MPSTQQPPTTHTAVLILEDAMRLSGELSLLLDGRLQLDNVRPEQSTELPHPINLAKGRTATLALRDDAATGQTLQAAKVKISRLFQDSITLEFDAADAAIAARYRELIGGGRATAGRAAAPASPAAHVAPAAPRPDAVAGVEDDAAQAPPARTANAGVTAQYMALLETFEARSLEELRHALKPFLFDLATHMRALPATLIPLGGSRNDHVEAAHTLLLHSAKIAEQMVGQIRDFFRDLTPHHNDDRLWQYQSDDASRAGHAKLDLVDLKQFEDFLAIERMVTHGEELHQLRMEALTLRVATLIGADPNRVRLPIAVRQLSRAFQSTLTRERIPQGALGSIYDYFTRQFIAQLDGYYQPLNQLLVDSAVLPDIETEIETIGSLLKRNQPVIRPHPNTHQHRRRPAPAAPGTASAPREGGPATDGAGAELNQLHRQIGEQLANALGHSRPSNLYRSVVDALNFKREAEGLADGQALARGSALSGTWDGATVASTDIDQSRLADARSIARALSDLQRNSQARDEVQRSDSLRAYLASHRDHIGGLRDSSGLTADSLNQLDMVDNLFGTIRSQLDVSSELKPTLGNLQIPLAKLALLDPRFFVDHTHTARAVVDKLSRLAASANFPNKALEGRINELVDDIVRDYETDDSVFAAALEKIEKLVAQQERALARNIERVVRTQEGQQKLADARRDVGRIISEHLPPPVVPKVLQDLLDNGWRELLVLTHIKNGIDSAAWADQLRTLDLLCLWLDERRHQEGGDDLRVQRSLEAGPLIDLLGQQIATAVPTNVTHEEVLRTLRSILAGDMAVEVAAVGVQPAEPEAGSADIRARIEDLPRLRRWVKRVEQLQPNSWLSYRDKSGQKKRMQLAWVSPDRGHYIFVNERGQKVADLSAIQLARQLSRGAQPPAPTDKLSVVDQSMYYTLEHVQKSLSFARNHDSLTRLINRDTFLDQMRRALRHSQAKHSQHAVLCLNIDQFKLVNEVYDRISGDQVLLEFAKLLAQLHGKKSSSARLQADEFAILLLDRTLDQAVEIAERIRADIAASSMDIEGENVSFTVSIGVAAILDYTPAVEDVLDAARTAMRHAKHRGRNQVVRFEEEQGAIEDFKQEKSRKRRDLESALASDRFFLRAQPIVQTAVADRSNSTLHYELLLGLLNKDGSLSSPEEFIQSAERYGFMTLVDRWVVREAFTWISRLMDEQKVVPNLAINLSGASVTDDSFMEYLLEQISEFGVGTSRLCFEITETGTISNLVKAADFVRAFRNIGCKFSIDDFGTGLASHNYLRELPVDYVKIDGSFITGVDKNRNDYAMARSINDLAHFLGQETIAESVESDEIIVKLEEMGVDYLQGWGICHPKPLAEVTADLSNLEK